MKNSKIFIIILSSILIISVGFNIYFLLNLKNTKEYMADLQVQLDKSNNEISSLNSIISEKESQIEDLEAAKLGTVNGYEVDNEEDNMQSDNNTTFQGNGNGVDVLIPDDFPYVDREVEQEEVQQEEVTQTPVPEVKEQQQPVNTPAPQSPSIGTMPTGPNGSSGFGGSMGTGTGEGAIGSFGTYE